MKKTSDIFGYFLIKEPLQVLDLCQNLFFFLFFLISIKDATLKGNHVTVGDLNHPHVVVFLGSQNISFVDLGQP